MTAILSSSIWQRGWNLLNHGPFFFAEFVLMFHMLDLQPEDLAGKAWSNGVVLHQQYIPWNMHTVLLRFVLSGLCYCSSCGFVDAFFHPNSKVHGGHLEPTGPRWAPCWPHLGIFSCGQSYDCPSASEVTWRDIGKIDNYLTTIHHSKVQSVCIFLDNVYGEEGYNRSKINQLNPGSATTTWSRRPFWIKSYVQ